MRNILTSLADHLDKHQPLVLATILHTSGSTPQVRGASALFSADELLEGTLGGGILEGDAQKRAAEAIRSGHSLVYEFGLEADITSAEGALCGGKARILLDVCTQSRREVFLDLKGSLEKRSPGVLVSMITPAAGKPLAIDRYWVDTGMMAAGTLPEVLKPYRSALKSCLEEKRVQYSEGDKDSVFMQAVLPYPRLLIAGAGHIGRALAHLGNLLEFEVTVIDDRAEYASRKNIPGADHLVVEDIGEALRNDPKTGDTYIVIVTRGHTDDAAALRGCIGSGVAYIGMIGSRTKISLMRTQFLEEGWATAGQWEQVHTPIGLKIGSKTVQEIAISIAAELIQERQRLMPRQKKPAVCGVVLAAGESKRMGSPKQLLPFGETSIIETVIRNIEASFLDHAVIVLGAYYEEIAGRIGKYNLILSRNRDYEKGMFTSVQQGLMDLPADAGSVMILLGDQPMISDSIIDKLIDAYHHSGKRIAIASHRGKRGHPVLFDVACKEEILVMGPDKSLRDFLDLHRDDILEVEVDSPDVLRDIDTEKEYKAALKQ